MRNSWPSPVTKFPTELFRLVLARVATHGYALPQDQQLRAISMHTTVLVGGALSAARSTPPKRKPLGPPLINCLRSQGPARAISTA